MHYCIIYISSSSPLKPKSNTKIKINESDFKYEYFKSRGAGGQHRNKTTSGVRCIHIPSGIKQERTSKCQHSNKKEVTDAVINMIMKQQSITENKTKNILRKGMVGTGMRGDKRRTYRFQDDTTVDHVNNCTGSCKRIMKGYFDILWK